MKAYLINLDRSHERLVLMEEQFQKVALPFVRVAAVDGKSITDGEFAGIKRNSGWKQPLTKSEIGCFLSHRKCLELIVQSGDKFGAVFEDDAKFSVNAQQFFMSDDWLTEQMDLVKLETHVRKVLTDEPAASVAGGYTVARLRSQHILSAGYIISAKCARMLLSEMNAAAAPMDHLLFTPSCGFFNKMAVFQVSPAVCGQAGLESTLGGGRNKEYKRPPVLQRIIRETKRPFMRIKTALWGLYINIFTKQRWAVIPPIKD